MILADTSVWIDHLQVGDARMVELPERNMMVMHPFVIGEIAGANVSDRPVVLGLLQALPTAVAVRHDRGREHLRTRGSAGFCTASRR
jgi:predicted nucleic acid-binding protein